MPEGSHPSTLAVLIGNTKQIWCVRTSTIRVPNPPPTTCDPKPLRSRLHFAASLRLHPCRGPLCEHMATAHRDDWHNEKKCPAPVDAYVEQVSIDRPRRGTGLVDTADLPRGVGFSSADASWVSRWSQRPLRFLHAAGRQRRSWRTVRGRRLCWRHGSRTVTANDSSTCREPALSAVL